MIYQGEAVICSNSLSPNTTLEKKNYGEESVQRGMINGVRRFEVKCFSKSFFIHNNSEQTPIFSHCGVI